MQWRCSLRRAHLTCNATVIQRGDIFTRGKNDHCHPGDHTVCKTIGLRREVIFLNIYLLYPFTADLHIHIHNYIGSPKNSISPSLVIFIFFYLSFVSISLCLSLKEANLR